jgi:hypothetical protein
MKSAESASRPEQRLLCTAVAVFFAASVVAEETLPPEFDDFDEIVFAVRPFGADFHWYANFGYYACDEKLKAYSIGAQLCRLHLRSGEVTVLLDDPEGGVRDPQVHYDGKRILFSYRKGGTDPYHLYEINTDGTGLRQLTDGPYDDIEPTYLPDGGIAFCSSRCKRWVNCWLTHVATLYRCDDDGSNIRPLSSNNEHDNTPWVLPDGRILYMRWEYVDRSQVDYHHLWTMNPDGTGQMVYYGNMHPGTLMIDAKPIPGTSKVVSVFSPRHGRRSHAGAITVVTPKAGPDEQASATQLNKGLEFRDPYPLSENCILVAHRQFIEIMNAKGKIRRIYALPKELGQRGYQCHEPRPIMPRRRERVIAPRVDLAKATGNLILSDVNEGRRMEGVKTNEITELLVLETLPMPIHYIGGMRPITNGGSFTLERVVGTVPVEPDGSAYIELPALRSFFFVALDENRSSVKRMQSFLTVMPGETTSCVGCHEPRTKTPPNPGRMALQALQRPPSAIRQLKGIPEVYDFPRDIQPILDKHCVPCHGEKNRKGGVTLSGARGAQFTHSYYTLTMRGQIADGRNRPVSNLPPRAIGTSASKLMKKLDGSHHDVQLSKHEIDLIRFWIEAGATYPGTYAALGSGMIGHNMNLTGDLQAKQIVMDREWPSSKAAAAAIDEHCGACHNDRRRHLPRFLSENGGPGKFSRHLVFNFSRPENSAMLLAPLASEAGGWGACRKLDENGKWAGPVEVFTNVEDPAYKTILAMIQDGKRHIERMTWFNMKEFRPLAFYVREMKRFGVLDEKVKPGDVIDAHATDLAYWESLWWQPQS